MRCRSGLWLCTLWLAIAFPAAGADPAPRLAEGDVGTISFPSAGTIVPTGARTPMALKEATVTLTGELRFPDGAGPFPAVILAHGCAGNGYADKTWGPVLRQWGYATFVVDSFGGRRLKEVCGDVSRLYPVQRLPDVYGALRVLVTHPRIAADRVALMGFSHGGIVTVSAATVWARDTFAPEGRPRFRAFFPVYPYCNAGVPEYEAISAPMRIHAGAIDDWTPAAPCVALAERLRANGFDAEALVHANAHHGFDDPFGATTTLPSVINVGACFPRYESILGPSTLPNPWAGCAKKGATVGRNPKAIEAAQAALRAQLESLLAPR